MLVEQMLRRTSKSYRPSTPNRADRLERVERTTVTPRERPKAARAATTTAAGQKAAAPLAQQPTAQRKLVTGAYLHCLLVVSAAHVVSVLISQR